MREKLLNKLAAWHAGHPWRMLSVALLATLILAGLSGQLTITMRTSDLLPEGDPKVAQFNRILEEFVTATNLVIVLEGEEERIKEMAEVVAPRLLLLKDDSQNEKHGEKIKKLDHRLEKLRNQSGREAEIEKIREEIADLQSRIDKPLFQRVDYKTPVDFLKNHALMLAKADDLKNMKDVYMDANLTGLITNLNNSMEKEYVGKEESISTREEEDGAVTFLDGIGNLILELQSAAKGEEIAEMDVHAAVDKLLLGEPYFLSYDKQAILLTGVPDFSLMDRDLLMVAATQADQLLEELREQFPDVRAGITGQIARERDEQVHSEQSIGFTTIIALVAILIFLMFSFRMWVAPLMATANLMVGLIWAMGAAYLVVGQLNMMTAMLSVMFLGLGIDFSIHIISGFSERRALGDGIFESLQHTFQKSGKGILTGALTTACAFLTLVISQARGMREMGLVAGTGLLAILLATFLVLPVMLVFREWRLERIIKKKPAKTARVRRDISFQFLGRMGSWLSRHYIFTLLASLLISAVLVWSATKITWDYDFRNMEPKGLTSIELMDTIMEKFDLSMEYALVLTDSLEESRQLADKYRDLGTVAITEDITQLLPTSEQQERRIPHINEIRRMIAATALRDSLTSDDLSVLRREIERLQDNIMEMQDMAFVGGRDKVDNKCKTIVGDVEDPESKNQIETLLTLLSADALGGLSAFQSQFAPYLKDSIITMCSTESIRLEDIPRSLLDRYSNQTRDVFMVTIYPSGSLYDGLYVTRFAEDLERISPKTTGWAPLMISLMEIFGRDGRNAILLTLGIVFILLWIDFKKIRYALMAMVPLAFGMFWMVGLMNLSGILLSMTTVMGLPLIVGIGIDDGVHIMHRWRSEGENRIYTVFSSTGKAILLTSVTTMLAFGSLVFSSFPAWGQFGGSLFLGVGACFLTTVLILPGIMGFIERKNHRSGRE